MGRKSTTRNQKTLCSFRKSRQLSMLRHYKKLRSKNDLPSKKDLPSEKNTVSLDTSQKSQIQEEAGCSFWPSPKPPSSTPDEKSKEESGCSFWPSPKPTSSTIDLYSKNELLCIKEKITANQGTLEFEPEDQEHHCASCPKCSNAQLSGPRVVDINYLLKQIATCSNHPIYGCGISDMKVTKESRNGLNSTLHLTCNMRGINKNLELTKKEGEMMNANTAITLGTISTGNSFAAAEAILTTLEIPFVCFNTYKKLENELGEIIHDTAWKSMELAGQEEAELAKKLGEVDKDKVPYITVIADGAWSKRSYSVNYDALSGVACIIGQRTGKLLFLGVRNKYCSLCSRAESKEVETPDHACSKNWIGTSTSMESDI